MTDELFALRRPVLLAPWMLALSAACAGGGDAGGAPAHLMSGAGGGAAVAGNTATAGGAGNTGAAGTAMAPAGRSGASGSAGMPVAGTSAGSGGSSGGVGGGSSGMGGGSAGSGSGGAASGSGGSGTFDPSAGPPDIPMPTGTCPEFSSGNMMFSVMGMQRRVVVSMSSAAESMSGPLIFYWHATGGAPSEAQRGLPVSDITAVGGIVVAPVDVSNAGVFPWLSQFPQHDALFDEVLACAVQKTKIDVKRIHALGWSAGGIMTTHLSFTRSKYMASVVTYSGGGTGMFQETNNKFAAMIMAGGPGDQLVLNFYTGSMTWQAALKQAGHFAMFCDHGGGHSIPTRRVSDVWQFFIDHPYGTQPSPYAGMIPASIASICEE